VSDRLFFDYSKSFVQPITFDPERVALVVVDMQYHDASPDQGFNLALDRIDPGCMDYFNERNESQVVPGIARLVQAFRDRALPIVFLLLGSEYRDLRDVPPRLRAWIRQLEQESGVEDIFWAGNSAYAVRKEFEPQEGDTIIRKTTFGAFNSSTVDATLQSMGVDTLIITGVSTNCCVETTARDAADRGYACAIVEECTADYDPAAHDAAFRAFHFNFGRIISTGGDVLEAIDKRLSF
jgi:biuret amidohydrolase